MWNRAEIPQNHPLSSKLKLSKVQSTVLILHQSIQDSQIVLKASASINEMVSHKCGAILQIRLLSDGGH